MQDFLLDRIASALERIAAALEQRGGRSPFKQPDREPNPPDPDRTRNRRTQTSRAKKSRL